MERTHIGKPVIITWEEIACNEVELLGNVQYRIFNADVPPPLLVYLQNERKIEVITWIGDGAFRTREPDCFEMARFEKAYYEGRCTAEYEGVKKQIKP